MRKVKVRTASELPGAIEKAFSRSFLPRHDFGEVVEGHVGGLLTLRGLRLLLFGSLRFLFFLRRGGLFRFLRLLFRGSLFWFLCCLLRSGLFRLFRRFFRGDLFRLLYRFFQRGGFGRFLLLPRSRGAAPGCAGSLPGPSAPVRFFDFSSAIRNTSFLVFWHEKRA